MIVIPTVAQRTEESPFGLVIGNGTQWNEESPNKCKILNVKAKQPKAFTPKLPYANTPALFKVCRSLKS
jgi:hypothetical protein